MASVGAQVALQQPGTREGLPAHVTLVVEVVCEDVHGERRHGDVHLATDVTLLGIGGVEAPVGLLMPGEVRAGGVVLAALRTSVLGLVLVDQGETVLALLGSTVNDGQGGAGGKYRLEIGIDGASQARLVGLVVQRQVAAAGRTRFNGQSRWWCGSRLEVQ